MTENEREIRKLLMPIAVLEHHQLVDPMLSPYDICDRLGLLWPEIRRDAEADTFTLDLGAVVSVNERVANSLGMGGCLFRDSDGWVNFVGELQNAKRFQSPSYRRGCGQSSRSEDA